MDLQPPVVQKDWQTKIFEFFAVRNKLIVTLFWFVYIPTLVILLAGAYQIVTLGPHIVLASDIGKKFGQLALSLLGVVVLPGILGRFKVEIKITRLITLFRRQLGILVFLLAFSHYILVRFLPTMTILPLSPFELMGSLALVMLFFMFLTSNNISMRHLGRWWKRLHRIIYVILWLLVLHTGLQRISIWTIMIGFFAILEVVSLIYDWWRKRSLVPKQPI